MILTKLKKSLIGLSFGMGLVGCGAIGGKDSTDAAAEVADTTEALKGATEEEKKAARINATAYSTNFAPGSLALSFPSSLSSSSTTLRLVEEIPPFDYDPSDYEDGGAAGDPSDPGAGAGAGVDDSAGEGGSQGQMQLTEAVDQIRLQLADLERFKNAADAMVSDAEECTITDGVADDCTLTEPCTQFSLEMAKDVFESVGEHAFKDPAKMDALIGEDLCFQKLVVKKLANDPSGFIQSVNITLDEDNSITLLWTASDADGHQKTKILQSFATTFGDFENADFDPSGAPPPVLLMNTASEVMRGKTSLTYNSKTMTFSATSNFTETFNDETSTFSQDIKAKALSEKLALAGIELTAKMEWASSSSSFSSKLTVSGDNNGVFIRDDFTTSMETVTDASISGTCEVNANYDILKPGTDIAKVDDSNLWQYSIGQLFCSTGTPLKTDLFIMQKVPAANVPNLVLAKVDWGESGATVTAAPGIVINSLTLTPEHTYACHETLLDSKGKQTSERHADGKKCANVVDADWSGALDAGAYFVDEGAIEISDVKIAISGITDTDLRTLAGVDDATQLFIVRNNPAVDFATLAPFSEEFFSEILGDGFSTDPGAAASTTALSYEVHFWGAPEEVGTAKVYIEAFGENGAPTFKEVTAAVLSQK